MSSSSFQLGLPKSTTSIELPMLSTLQTRNSSVTLQSQITNKPKTPLSATVSTLLAQPFETSQIQPLIDLLRQSADPKRLKQAKFIHAFLLKSNFEPSDLTLLLNHLSHAYSKCDDFDSAHKLFDQMSQRNVFSWTVMIVGATENGFAFDGFNYFVRMLDSGFVPDKFTCSALPQTCVCLNDVELAQMVHAQIVIRGFSSHTVVATSLLNMYGKLRRTDESIRVFNTMNDHNIVTWNAMISGLTLNGSHLDAYCHFLRMMDEGTKPNKSTLICVSKAAGQLGNVEKCKAVEQTALKLGLESDVQLGTALIDMYSKCVCLDDARLVFDSNFSDCEENPPWNAMISGYSQHRLSKEALLLYVKMCQNGVLSDIYTYCSIYHAIADLKYLNFGKEVHGMVIKFGQGMMGTSVYNAIADAYGKCGALEDARKVFDTMEEKDLVSWTTLVTAYSQSRECDEALAVFSEMREDTSYQPNQFTYSGILISCGNLCFLEYGQQVHGLLCKAGFDNDKCTESALIDMYSKCGCIKEAEKVFEQTLYLDTISCTAMISGYAQHGMTKEALRCFTKMELLGLKPNAVTLLCVLFACSHGGMVEEGLHYFQMMEEIYSLVPEMEHYACIADLLGRVGRLNEALEFIMKMPIQPNQMVWQALLGACRVHGNVELAEVAANKIFSINPEYSSTYVLLSNTYKEAGSTGEGMNLRDLMKEQGVKKDPGYSWISVNGRVHKFYSGDQHHPEKDDIYAKLDGLREKVKTFPYLGDLNLAS